jgi:hypothetical protein
MSQIPIISSEKAASPRSSRRGPRRVPLRIYAVLLVIFVLGIAIQVFLAGAGIFQSAAWIEYHSTLGHTLPLIPLVLLILGLVGRQPRSVNWLTLLLFAITYFQPWFIYVAHGLQTPILAALHPVNALLIFTLPLYLIYRTRQTLQQVALRDNGDL